MAKAKNARGSVGSRIISGLKDAVEKLERGEPLTYRTVAMKLEPTTFTPKKIVATRDLLAVSQGLFAEFLGVSSATVRAWEQGQKDPSNIARRFMDEIRKNPDYWRKRLQESIQVKTTVR